MNRGLRDRDLWDVLAVLCLGGLVTWGWEPTYAGIAWWVAALVTALFALCVLLVVRDMAGNVIVAIGIMLLAYVLAAGPIAAGTLAVRGGETFTDGLAATGEVWRRLLDTHPPVDATAVLLLPPVITALVVVGLGAATALWTTRPAAPLVPVAAGLATVLLLGRHEAGSAVLLGAGVAGVSMLWVRMRAGRLDEVRFGADPVSARGLVLTLAVLLVGSAAAAGTVGEPEADRYVLRDHVRAYDVRPLRTPLDEFRDFTPQPPGTDGNVAGERLFVVRGVEPGTRLRFAALDTYDSRHWKADSGTDELRDDDAFKHVSSRIDNPADGDEITVEITATRFWNRPWVPTVGAVQAFDFDDESIRDDLRYNPATQTAVLPDGLEAGVTYSIRTRKTDLLARPELEPSDALDDELHDDLFDFGTVIIAWNEGAPSIMSSLFDVLHRLRLEGRFSHGAEPWEQEYRAGHSERRLGEDFLFTSPPVGDQEQYAAAAALLATRRGVPARVVVGAVVPSDHEVHGRDVTAWIEVRVADGTWRTIPTDEFMGRRPPHRGEPPPDVFDFPDFPPSDPLDETNDVDEAADVDPDRADSDGDPGSHAPWFLLLLMVPLVPALLKWRRRRRRLRDARMSTRYAGAWDELVDRARDLGVPVTVRATRPAQAAELDRAGDLATHADRVIFSVAELDAAGAREFWQLVHSELRKLDGTRPRWRRWWAVVNPRSLWGG